MALWRRRMRRDPEDPELQLEPRLTPECDEFPGAGSPEECFHAFIVIADPEDMVRSCECRCHSSCPAHGVPDRSDFDRLCHCPGYASRWRDLPESIRAKFT